MDKYEVLGLLGEGSFGRVYKAKLINDSTTVALKVISKRGRSVKEIKGLRRECEIQRHLHHPNIIQMLDSFETDNEIVVITEFAHKELTAILSKEGYLSEERVQAIVWDLVSALYYLHSHRVLHRDLKPQNILLDSQNKAKLCDFGFARNMSTGTHVLTSIKGTPLYMAPELIEEHPYDHSADLWSLGCIIYELLVGAPPFCTTSILHLIRMIRHEQIQFPTFISDNCISFLKGLLQKDPTKRLSWPDILKHPFMKGHILILDDVPSKPLTRPLSIDTLEAKEQQRKNCLTQKAHATKLPSSKSSEATNSRVTNVHKQTNAPKSSEACTVSNAVHDQCIKLHEDEENSNIDEKFAVLTLECHVGISKRSSSSHSQNNSVKDLSDINKNSISSETSIDAAASNIKDIMKIEDNLIINEDSSPIENEEWIVFLQRTIEEVMSGEMTSLCQLSLANICISPLHNSNASSKVLIYVASLFSLPFVVGGVSDDAIKQIKKVYVDLKLIPNLVCASKLIFKHKERNVEENSSSTKYSPSLQDVQEECVSISDLDDEDLEALERLYLLICHLVYLDEKFLNQFCDVTVILNMYSILRKLLLLSRRKTRIVVDLMAILTHILRRFPDKVELICEIILISKNESREDDTINFIQLLRHSNSLLRERSCYFLQFLAKASNGIVESIWSDVIRDTLEALIYDSMENVRNAAEVTVEDLKKFSFYNTRISTSTNSKELCCSNIV